MTNEQIVTYTIATLAPILAALVAGRFLRRLVLKPFEWWAGKTENKFDDQLIQDAKHDLDLPDEKDK